jgi:hypothetical protein
LLSSGTIDRMPLDIHMLLPERNFLLDRLL